VRAAGAGRGDREDRVLVDHRGRALGRHLDALERARAHDQVADRLAASVRGSRGSDVAAHLDQRLDEPVRSGLRPTSRIVTSEPGTSSAATIGKAAEDGSPGTRTVGR
jgi:hypothetical protein